MKKSFKLLFLVAVLTLFVPSVMAAEKTASTDAELIDAFNTAVTGDTIKLTDNIEHTGGKILVGDGKDITLDLNGYNIVTKAKNDRSITVYNGILTIKGKGTIKHETHNALNVWGSDKQTSKIYSKLNVEKDVTLEGDTGLAIFQGYNDEGAYGTEVNFAGKINAKSLGITTNGLIIHANGPVVNIKNGASITTTGADGVAVYEAGNGIYNIEAGTTITGATAVEVRAGILNVKGAEALYVNNTQGNSAEDWAKVKTEVTGGTFSTDVSKYVTGKYVAKLVNGQYVVEENKVIESNDKKITFESEKALDNDLELRIDEATKEEKEAAEKKVDDLYKDNKDVKDTALISLYDIKVGLQQADEFEVVPMENGKFTISITLDDNAKKYDNYKVIYIDDQGNISETIDAKLVDGKIVFETSHLSVYGIVGYNNAAGASINNPNTGDNLSMIIILGGLSLIILSGAALKLKKSN